MDDIWILLAAAAGLGATLPRAVRRLQLSRAKHPSLAGHSRLSKRVARLIPALTYGEERFFRADGAPDNVAAQRQAAFESLAALFRERYARTAAFTDVAAASISDLQFTARYRVPFPFSERVRRELRAGSFVQSSADGRLADLDGNELADLTGAYGVNVFGTDFYRECIEEGSRRAEGLGPVLGPLHPMVAENAQRLREISGLDEVSFHMSGTEAVMQAVRLARYHTGRRYLVRFNGAYHGWWEDVQPGVGNPLPPRETYTLRDLDERTLRVLDTRRDIACVLVNPLQALHPNMPAPGDSSLVDSARRAGVDRAAYSAWLDRLRDVCTRRGIVLILDEVFVGFRLAERGAQEYFGVRADMVTYGKTLGGGLPVGVVCGRKELMRRFREDRPADICFARGTFNSHPYVMGAMKAFLDRLQRPETRALYDGLDARWDARAARMNEALAAAGAPALVAHLSSIWTLRYTEPSAYNWMFQYYLRAEGIALPWTGTGRLLFPINLPDADFEAIVSRVGAAARAMAAGGWWWAPAGTSNKSLRRGLLRELLRARIRESLGHEDPEERAGSPAMRQA